MKTFGVTFDDFGGDRQHLSSDSLVCTVACNSDFEILTALQTYIEAVVRTQKHRLVRFRRSWVFGTWHY